MKPIDLMTTIQIEITNYCNLSCAACTRHAGHQRNRYHMDLDLFEDCLKSMEGYEGLVGIMGGEPTLHPAFPEILAIYREYIPKERRGLWTNMAKWDKYEDIILETFYQDPAHMLKNDHKGEKDVHHPLLLAAKDMIDDEILMWRLIHDCPYQNRWSASINPKGAFFCEVAAAQDILFEGPGGWPIERGWRRKRAGYEFWDQVERYCPLCGGAVPVAGVSPRDPVDLISPSVEAKFLELGYDLKYQLVDRKVTEEELRSALTGKYRPLKHHGEVE